MLFFQMAHGKRNSDAHLKVLEIGGESELLPRAPLLLDLELRPATQDDPSAIFQCDIGVGSVQTA